MATYRFDYGCPPAGYGRVFHPDGSVEDDPFPDYEAGEADREFDEHVEWLRKRGVTHVIDPEADPHPLGDDHRFDEIEIDVWVQAMLDVMHRRTR